MGSPSFGDSGDSPCVLVLEVTLAGPSTLSFTWSLRVTELATLESSHLTPLVVVEAAFVESCGALSSTGSLRAAESATLESHSASSLLLEENLVKSCEALPSIVLLTLASFPPAKRALWRFSPVSIVDRVSVTLAYFGGRYDLSLALSFRDCATQRSGAEGWTADSSITSSALSPRLTYLIILVPRPSAAWGA